MSLELNCSGIDCECYLEPKGKTVEKTCPCCADQTEKLIHCYCPEWCPESRREGSSPALLRTERPVEHAAITDEMLEELPSDLLVEDAGGDAGSPPAARVDPDGIPYLD